MFGQYVRGRNDAIEWKWRTGQTDRVVNRGPPGTDRILGNVFTGASRPAELHAYERIHTGVMLDGTPALGLGQIRYPQGVPFVHPDTGHIIEPAPDGTLTLIDGEFLEDAAATVNERREYYKKLFSLIFNDDDTLRRLTGKDFMGACNKNGDVQGMPPALVPSCCLPSVMFYLPENSEAYSLAVAKASWLLQNHPDMRGKVLTGTKPKTQDKAPRGARSALEEAVA